MNQCHREFAEMAARDLALRGPVLEIGSFQVEGQAGSDLRDLFPYKTFLGADMRPGKGVDVVCDCHARHPEWDRTFRTVICIGTLEHVARPWEVVANVRRWLIPGGLFVASTVFAFRIHAYPSDYWRYTPAGLEELCRPFDCCWSEQAGPAKRPHTVVVVAGRDRDCCTTGDFLRSMLGWQRRWKHTKSLPRRFWRAVKGAI